MRIAAIMAFVALVHLTSAPIAAQQRPNGSLPQASPFGNGNRFVPPSKPASPPRFLFPTPTFNQSPDARASKPAVLCGMTLIPGDPNVDPAIRREVPADAPRFAIRSVDPQLCRQP